VGGGGGAGGRILSSSGQIWSSVLGADPGGGVLDPGLGIGVLPRV